MSDLRRRNSIVKRLWNGIRGRRDVEDLNNPYIIVSNFRETNERECGKVDSKNERKYHELLRKANKAEKTIKNSGLSMNVEVPPPPHPSNRDRYILWKKRNSVKHVIPQTKAVHFLTKEGYTLDKDYEAYQAIDLANEVRKRKGLPLENEDETIYFKNVFTNRDRNIFRKRSMVRTGTRRAKESLSTSPSESSLDSLEKLEQSKYLRVIDRKKSPATNLPVHHESSIEPPIITESAVQRRDSVQEPVVCQQGQQVQQGQQGQQLVASAPPPLPMPNSMPQLKAVGFGGTLTF